MTTPPRPSRDLRLLAGAVFLSAAGDLLVLVVLALHLHALTADAAAVSALFAAMLVPTVLLAPLSGLVADRVEGVRVLVAASLAQAAVAVALAATGEVTLVLALAALLAAGNAFGQPAEFRLVPAVAGSRPVTAATGVVEAARHAGLAAGPLLAAALTALGGARLALLVAAAAFAAVAATAAALGVRRPPAPAAAGAPARALDGVRVLRGDQVLRVTVGAAVGALLVVSAVLTVEVFFVKDVIGASDAAYAVVVAGWMAGMVTGAVVLARRVPVRLAAAGALVALAVQGAGLAGQTVWAVLPVALAGYVVGGVGHGVKNVLLRALLTHRVPAEVHGRAFAAYAAARNTAELAAVGTGAALVGALGPRAALLVAGLAPLLAAAAGLAALAPRPAVARRLAWSR